MTDEQKRIRSYLQAQAAKLAPSALVERVRTAMEDLRAAVHAVPAARFDARPAEGEWSANEVMAHVVTTGARFADAIVRILDGQPAGSSIADRLERDVPRRSAAEWWERLALDREALFTRVLAADPESHLDGAVEHGMFGLLNWRETLLFLRIHDLDHARQLQQITAAG
jgi:hypothetical protein